MAAGVRVAVDSEDQEATHLYLFYPHPVEQDLSSGSRVYHT